MNETVVIDGQVNLLAELIGDPTVSIPADCKEFETGNITFSSAVQAYGISFKREHTTAPSIILFYDQTGTYDSTAYSLLAWIYVDHQTLFGVPMYPTQANSARTITYILWRSISQASNLMTTPMYNFGDVTNQRFVVRANPTTPVIMMRPRRLFKWIAIWR